jgi:hypothetical protein
MHIRTFTSKKISLTAVTKASGLKRRQIAYLAARRRIPGAQRAANGYHFEYFDTREYRRWLADRRIMAQDRNIPEFRKSYLFKPSAKTRVPMALRLYLREWKCIVLGNYPLCEWSWEESMNLKQPLLPFYELYEKAARQARYRDLEEA